MGAVICVILGDAGNQTIQLFLQDVLKNYVQWESLLTVLSYAYYHRLSKQKLFRLACQLPISMVNTYVVLTNNGCCKGTDRFERYVKKSLVCRYLLQDMQYDILQSVTHHRNAHIFICCFQKYVKNRRHPLLKKLTKTACVSLSFIFLYMKREKSNISSYLTELPCHKVQEPISKKLIPPLVLKHVKCNVALIWAMKCFKI